MEESDRFLVVVGLCALMLGACSDDSGPDQDSQPVRQATEEPKREPKPAKERNPSVLQLGDRVYELDLIICIGSTMMTATASDSMKRSDYPVTTVKIFDSAMTGGQSFDTVSAYFEREGYGENWALQDGVVSRDDDIVVASGTLKGSRLVPKKDGTRKSEPLEGDETKPFELRIQC